jgi:hypothetical protein
MPIPLPRHLDALCPAVCDRRIECGAQGWLRLQIAAVIDAPPEKERREPLSPPELRPAPFLVFRDPFGPSGRLKFPPEFSIDRLAAVPIRWLPAVACTAREVPENRRSSVFGEKKDGDG